MTKLFEVLGPDAMRAFWNFIAGDVESGCWEWAGGEGYKGRDPLRVAWALLKREAYRKDLELINLCGNLRCFNPRHYQES